MGTAQEVIHLQVPGCFRGFSQCCQLFGQADISSHHNKDDHGNSESLITTVPGQLIFVCIKTKKTLVGHIKMPRTSSVFERGGNSEGSDGADFLIFL